MPHVITDKCLGEVYATCQKVCPVDCIHFVDKVPEGHKGSGQTFMVIDPNECIDCGACLPECPIGAIVDDPSQAKVDAKENESLSPLFMGKKTKARPKKDPPRRADNKLV